MALRQAHASKRKPESPALLQSEPKVLMRLFQPFGVETEFLGHLDQFLRGFRILDGFGEPPGSVGLISIVVGLGHRSTFLDKYGLRQKGSTSGMAGRGTASPRGIGRMREDEEASNGILTRQRCRKTRPQFVLQEQKESGAARSTPDRFVREKRR
jgi:hypothetical protein